ncbi:FecR domain-containing protein [Pararobbsia silviterrae]|uniref:DUF4880 domain-containing protein n=1 Tax=Pararobbsia silviterrae TaxID=1792498 RepID=A0A494XGK8_9BURK|nr:FecR domain-containing protein [Pararobbsia silviterrae]RKP49658.1 DUF4880 domain-containing protein [Pararobbsia silviterrae]
MPSVPMTTSADVNRPLDAAVVLRASEWLARSWSGEFSDDERRACERWLAEHPDHALAWARLHAADASLTVLPRDATRRALLHPPVARGRRRALGLLGAACIAGTLGYEARRSGVWALATADFATRVGEIRAIALPDGSHLVLDTASAVDVAFSDTMRHVTLRAGRIYLATAHRPAFAGAPFVVTCSYGSVKAQGAQFSVAERGDSAALSVGEGAVEVRPAHASWTVARIGVGEKATFSADALGTISRSEGDDDAWTRGELIARDMRVGELVAALSRYRRGVLRCEPDAADLRVTGLFPLRDTDRALSDLVVGLPVEVEYRTRFWVTVRAQRARET